MCWNSETNRIKCAMYFVKHFQNIFVVSNNNIVNFELLNDLQDLLLFESVILFPNPLLFLNLSGEFFRFQFKSYQNHDSIPVFCTKMREMYFLSQYSEKPQNKSGIGGLSRNQARLKINYLTFYNMSFSSWKWFQNRLL